MSQSLRNRALADEEYAIQLKTTDKECTLQATASRDDDVDCKVPRVPLRDDNGCLALRDII